MYVMSKLIGIGGVSRAGKTSLAELLAREFRTKKNLSVQVIHQDQCVIPEAQLPLINGQPDWEHPVSIDWRRFKSLIDEDLKAYDFVIIEGLFAFYDQEIIEWMDHKIFLEIPKPLFLVRKRKDLRWGPEPEWYIQHIWTSYLRYGRPTLSKDYICINGARDYDVEALLADLYTVA